MGRTALLALIALACLASLAAEIAAQPEPATAVIRVRLSDRISQKALVERGIDIMHIGPDGRADLAVTDEQLAWVTSRGVAVSVLERVNAAAPADLDANLGLYHTYAEMMAALDSLSLAYPSLVHLEDLGTTYEGRAIGAIKISDNAATEEGEPEVLIMGCHHARELMSVEVPLRLAQHLLTRYGTDSEITNLVNGREIWIAPMINVDGHVYVEQNHSGSSVNWWRKNRKPNGDGSYGIDLNRNYGYNWGYDNVGSSPTPSSAIYRGPSAFSELEAQAVRDFCSKHNFVLSVSYHSYGDLILYPWGYAPLNTPDQELFAALGDTLSRGNGYLAGNAASGAIYITNGDSDDWLYGDAETKGVVYAFTVELNSYEDGGFSPAEALIGPTFSEVLGLNISLIALADNPRQLLGPQRPSMNPITMLNPPAYEISWSGANPSDPNPPVSYELTEIKNLTTCLDSVETEDTLWIADGFTLSTQRAYTGSRSYYSGTGNDLECTLSMAGIYPMWLPSTLTCMLWYDIEAEWDYAYLEGSIDEGRTWVTFPGNVTTDENPNGNNRGNGITGSSLGWVSAAFDLGGLVTGGTGFVLLRFRYTTDAAISNEGLYVDLINPVTRIEKSSVIASDYRETWFHRWPEELGDFLYCVRGFSAGAYASKRSDLAEQIVTDLSGSGSPPLASSLDQNFPNPFNPATTLRFAVGAADARGDRRVRASLRIYDVSGRIVAVLEEGTLPAGRYSVMWNGLGKGGTPAASGIYFAELRLDDRVFVRKMVLLK